MCALSVAGGITLILVVLWIVTFFPQASSEEAAQRAVQAPSPLAAFRDSATHAFDTAKEQFQGLDDMLKSSIATTSTTTERGGN